LEFAIVMSIQSFVKNYTKTNHLQVDHGQEEGMGKPKTRKFVIVSQTYFFENQHCLIFKYHKSMVNQLFNKDSTNISVICAQCAFWQKLVIKSILIIFSISTVENQMNYV